MKDDYAVIIIDNPDISKPASNKLEALSEIRDGSTGEITQGYLTPKCVRTPNLKMQEKKKLCHIITRVYLLRWRIVGHEGLKNGETQKDLCNSPDTIGVEQL